MKKPVEKLTRVCYTDLAIFGFMISLACIFQLLLDLMPFGSLYAFTFDDLAFAFASIVAMSFLCMASGFCSRFVTNWRHHFSQNHFML